MNDSAQRILAIVLASSFALVSSLALGWFVYQHTFGSRTPNPPLQTERRPAGGGENASHPPRRPGGTTGEQAIEKSEPERTSESELGRPPEVLEEYGKRGPRMTARTPGGEKVLLPMVESDYSVDIRGDLATVSIEQTFENPGELPLDATYQLPMSEDAAVYEMIMRVGDRRIRGVVKEKQEAREEYEQARQEGRAAALLEQQRANLFTQKLANVMPGKPVEVTIRYVQNVEKVDGNYHLVVPLVVGPRYNPADMSNNQLVDSGDESSSNAEDGKAPSLPPAGELQAPDTVDPDRVGVDVRLEGGVPVAAVGSSSHDITIEERDPTTRNVELTEGRTIGNRHFVLSYKLEGRSTQAGVLTHWSEERGEGYFSILVEPPAAPSPDEVAAREMVFLLDTSGSMRGAPMKASKAYMRYTLQNLRPKDSFRIVEFDSDTGAMSERTLPATEENVEKALAYVGQLQGDGGTELVPGLKRALGAEPTDENRIRYATVLSDGYVGNEYEVVETVREEIGETRLSALGVGSGTNRFALEEMAELGRGLTRYIDRSQGDESIRETAREVAEKFETPVLTDVSVDWGELSPHQTTPERIPDLFAGQSVRIMGRYDEPGSYELEVTGRAGGERVDLPLEVELPGTSTDGKAVELTWARSRVEDFMHQLMTPEKLRQSSLSDKDLQRLVTQLGLDHDIATKWTSFVAVSEKVVNPSPEENLDAVAPEPQVANVTSSGYGRGARGAHGAPEPSIVGSLLFALLASLGIVGRKP